MVKHLLTMRETGFNPWVGKISWRRKWQPTPVPLPGKSDGRRSLVGYSPWGRKEPDMTEQLHFTSLHFIESEDYFVWYSHFDNINSSNPRTCSISPSVCVILISFNSVLEFSAYKSFVSLSRFILRYIVIFDAVGNGIISLISLSDLLLLVNRNATDFCVLIL